MPGGTSSSTSRSRSRSTRRASLAATAADTGRLLSVYQNRRWDSDFQGVRREVQAGTIGDVVEFRSEISRWRPQVRDRWRERPGAGAGLWYDLGPHLVDQALVLFGVPETVQAALRIQRPGGQTDDWFQVRLDYPTRQVLVSSSMLAADVAPRFVVRGTTGALVKQRHRPAGATVDGRGASRRAGLGARSRPAAGDARRCSAASVDVPAGDYGGFYAAMRDAIRGGRPVPVSAAEAIRVMAIIAAGFESSAAARAVSTADLVGA